MEPFPGRLQVGSRGKAVEALQQQLNSFGGPAVGIDGDFGEATERKVRQFQGHRDLGADGIVDAVTWALIFRQPVPETRAAKRRRLRHEQAERRLQAKVATGDRLTRLIGRLRRLEAALEELAKPETREQKIGRLRAELATARGARARTVRHALKQLTELPLRERAWRAAAPFIPTREVGFNGGETIARVIDYAGGAQREAYCVDGVIWCYGRSGSDIVKPGYTHLVENMLSDGVVKIAEPRTGDIVRYEFGHTGLFGYWAMRVGSRYVRCPRSVATHIVTREFNTSDSGALLSDANDGRDGIYQKARVPSLVTDYLHVPR